MRAHLESSSLESLKCSAPKPLRSFLHSVSTGENNNQSMTSWHNAKPSKKDSRANILVHITRGRTILRSSCMLELTKFSNAKLVLEC